MGAGVIFRCHHCKYFFEHYEGIGMRYSEISKEMKEAVMAGEMGEELQSFLKDHPSGCLDYGKSLYACPDCGTLCNEPSLDMYIADESAKDPDPLSDALAELSETKLPMGVPYYSVLFRKYDHRCPECNQIMNHISMDGSVPCPRCREIMDNTEWFIWD